MARLSALRADLACGVVTYFRVAAEIEVWIKRVKGHAPFCAYGVCQAR